MNKEIKFPLLGMMAMAVTMMFVFLAFSQPPLPPVNTNLTAIPNPPVITFSPQVVTNDVTPQDANAMQRAYARQNRVYPQTNHLVFHFEVVSNHLFTVVFDGTTNPLVRQIAVLRKFRTEETEVLELIKTTKIKEIEE